MSDGHSFRPITHIVERHRGAVESVEFLDQRLVAADIDPPRSAWIGTVDVRLDPGAAIENLDGETMGQFFRAKAFEIPLLEMKPGDV
ncbi:MAG TPA: hypothetical protein DC046_09025 [Rhodospirillaceae bacterium]|nr:hypothetical protein [Rhodospirillaceae bacterium]